MAVLRLRNGYDCLVDDEDIVRLPEAYWRAIVDKGGTVRSVGGNSPRYGQRRRDFYILHRVIMSASDNAVWVDHVNGNPLDNRKENLRLCTRQQNLYNRKLHKNNKSGYKGVSVDKETGLYVARLYIEKRMYVDGYSLDPAVSARAYDELARKHHGVFASVNFPRDEALWDRNPWACGG